MLGSKVVTAAGAIGVPNNVQVTNLTASSLTLSWNSIAKPGLTYNVYKDGVKIASNLSTTSHNVTGLTGGMGYSFTVTASRFGSEGQKAVGAPVNTAASPAFRFWRLKVGITTGSPQVLGLGEWQVVYDGVRHALTGLPLSYIAGSVGMGSGFALPTLIDGNAGSFINTPAWNGGKFLDLMVDLGVDRTVTAFALAGQSNGAYNLPASLQFFYSNDGVNWTSCATPAYIGGVGVMVNHATGF